MNEKIVLVVMDGIGLSNETFGDAVKAANTPTLDFLFKNYPWTKLKAHGTAVGLPTDDDMGNSEVGHNALGCGQIYNQGAKLVDESIKSKKIFDSETWKKVTKNCLINSSTLHFIGLLSDGNVHSNISHLKELIYHAKKDGVKQVRCHVLLDGRDVPALSAIEYIEDLEHFFKNINDKDFSAAIASGGGRMKITMDRYQASWDMVKLGWDTHVHGKGRMFESASDAIRTYRKEYNVVDQDIPPFIISNNQKPVGKIKDNDSVILFNFRGDRAIEISMAFENENFPYFDRGEVPNVVFSGMLQYDGDLKLPKNYLVSPPDIKDTLTELLNQNNINSYAVSETQKYGHVTYFWNGNRSEKFDNSKEEWYEIKSDNLPFEQRPWMKSAEIADHVIGVMNDSKYQFIRCNFPNGDMVGHTGSFSSTILAVESVDLAISRIIDFAKKDNWTVIITADHGNADQMYETKGNKQSVKTAHSLNPVPFIIYNKNNKFEIDENNSFGLANVAPTIADMFNISPFSSWENSMLKK